MLWSLLCPTVIIVISKLEIIIQPLYHYHVREAAQRYIFLGIVSNLWVGVKSPKLFSEKSWIFFFVCLGGGSIPYCFVIFSFVIILIFKSKSNCLAESFCIDYDDYQSFFIDIYSTILPHYQYLSTSHVVLIVVTLFFLPYPIQFQSNFGAYNHLWPWQPYDVIVIVIFVLLSLPSSNLKLQFSCWLTCMTIIIHKS